MLEPTQEKSVAVDRGSPTFDIDSIKSRLNCENLDVIQLYQHVKKTLSCLVHIHELGLAVDCIAQQQDVNQRVRQLLHPLCEQIAINGLEDRTDKRYPIFATYLQERYSVLADLCNSLVSLRYPRAQWLAEEAYPTLTESDRTLATEWLNGSKDGQEEARVLSARTAEKVVSCFFQQLGHEVQDIAITQLDLEGGNDWQTHDLLLVDTKQAIDVKNARWVKKNRSAYVEWCVPSFKKDRTGYHVTITGVLSPYLWLSSINNPDEIAPKYRPCPITALGETTRAEIDSIERKYNTAVVRIRLDNLEVIPPWIFDYPLRFYQVRERRLEPFKYYFHFHGLPHWKVFELIGINPLPLLLACNMPLPAHWIPHLTSWQVGAFESLHRDLSLSLTLPNLYLALIRHFLQSVTNGISTDDSWDGYDMFLYLTRDESAPLEFVHFGRMASDCKPLLIEDPLDIIPNLMGMMHNLWQHRNDPGIELNEFETFTFYGDGFLKGKRRNSSEFTVWADHCGTSGCGKSPLILGQNQSCPECGFLICDACKFCRKDCTTGERRQNADKRQDASSTSRVS